MKVLFLLFILLFSVTCYAEQLAQPSLRKDFNTAVMGKSQEEILALIGKPYKTHDGIDNISQWSYKNKTKDPITGNIDGTSIVIFSDGHVVDTMNY